MIQFNLLPDVKLEYIRVKRVNRLVIGTSLVASAAALLIFLMLFLTVDVFQKKNMSDLTKDIKDGSSKLQNTPDIAKIVTVQDQLSVLPGLHDQKVIASRLFGYMQGVTPTTVTISGLKADFTANTLSISGGSDTLDAVNTYIDTLKFTTFSTADNKVSGNQAFTNVVLSQFTRTAKNATYTITLNFDPAIFSTASDVKLGVPTKVTTRSETEKPTEIFSQNQTTNASGQ